jgi:hypothetical protein
MDNQSQTQTPLVPPTPFTPTIPTQTTPPIQTPNVVSTPTYTVSKQNDFNISEAIGFGWKMALKHFGSFIKISLPAIILMVLIVIIALIGGENPGPGMALISSLFGFLLSLSNLLVMSSVMVLSLMIVDNKIPEGKGVSMFVGKDTIITLMFASFIYSFKVMLWSFLFFIPGIYMSIKHFYAIWVAVDGRSYKGAYKKSGSLTNGVKLKLVWFMFLLSLINMAGMIALGLGMLITVPLSYIAMTYVYRVLAGNNFTVESAQNQSGNLTPINPSI